MRLTDIILSDTAARAICWMLIHSLWQGILVAALAGLIIYSTRRRPVALRYNLLAADLLLFLLLAGLTFGYELRQGGAGTISATAPVTAPAAAAVSAIQPRLAVPPAESSLLIQNVTEYCNAHAALITAIWLGCLSIQLLRLSGGLVRIGRIRRNALLPSGGYWSERLTDLARKLGIRRAVRLLESAGVQTPAAVGWLKPSILVPLGLLANLPPDQVETILLHELAHIRRNDYLANLVLYVAEALFFFNPGLRWVATLLRREREACCDDIVLAGTPDRNSYLEALVAFTQWVVNEKIGGGRSIVPQLGAKNDLLWRVRRMLNQENKKLQPAEKLILSVGLMALLLVSLVSMNRPAVRPHPQPAFRAVVGRAAVVRQADTIPTRANAGPAKVTIERLSIHSNDRNGQKTYHAIADDANGDQYEVRKRDGKVIEFRLNEELVPTSEYGRYTAVFDSIESARRNIPKPPAAPVPPVPAVLAPGATPMAAPTPVTPGTPAAPMAAPTPVAPGRPMAALALLAPRPEVWFREHRPTPDSPCVLAPEHTNLYVEKILRDLIRDGLAGDLSHISFRLTADELVVDGALQPNNIFQTYHAKYTQHPGDHIIYSQHWTPHNSGSNCICVHEPDMPEEPKIPAE